MFEHRLTFLILVAGAALLASPAAGPLRAGDCDLDGEDDASAIAAGTVTDCNENGVPDHCELKPRSERWSTLTLDGRPRRIAAADMDGDGILDLVAVRRRTVTVLLNGEEDPFARALDQLAGDSLASLALPDVDGDGFPDVTVIEEDRLWTLRNDGSGRPGSPVETAIDGALDVRTIDLDGDAFEDLALLRTDSVTLLRSVGDTTWSAWGDDVALASPPDAFAVGDLENDGDGDVVVIAGGKAQLVRNVGPGRIDVEVLDGLPDGTRNVLLSDLDHDSLPEVIAASPEAILVRANLGSGSFAEAAVYSPEVSIDPELLAAGDVDADGDTDLVAASGDGNGALIFSSSGRRIASMRRIELPEPPSDLILADVKGDAGADVVIVIQDTRRIGIVTGEDLVPDALGKLALTSFELDLHEEFEPHSTATADMDGDGDTDLVTMDGEDRVLVVFGDGRGGLELGEPFSVEGTSEIIAITAVDLDGDGDPDVAAVDESRDVLALLFNRGDGRFEQGDLHDLDTQPYQVHAAQLFGDELPEIVSVNEGGGTVEIFRNLGGGELRLEATLAVGESPVWAASGDFDADGDTDLAVAINDDDEVAILWNDGAGELAARDDLEVASPSSIAAADLDGDGDLDLVAASRASARVTHFDNDGEGRFSPVASIGIDRGANAVILPDVDGDGHLDVVTANPDSDSISVLLRRGGAFDAPVHLEVGAEPRYVVHADLDGDGLDDLISANHDSFDFTIFVQGEGAPAFRSEICTEADFYGVTERSEAWTIYTVTAAPEAGAPNDLTLFQDASRFPDHAAFLGDLFPQLAPPAEYEQLVLAEGTRRFLGGYIRRLATSGGPLYGFTVFTESAGDDVRPPDRSEAEVAFARLREAFHLGPLVYAPDSAAARAAAGSWSGTEVPVFLGDESAPRFRRGDADGSGQLNLTDALVALNFLFLSGAPPGCLDAADANDDGDIDVTDAIVLLSFLFLSTAPLPAPSPGCGPDLTPDAVPCGASPSCS